MSVDRKVLEEAVRALRARFAVSILRILLGFLAGELSVVTARLLGPDLGCAMAVSVGLALYLASAPLVRSAYGGLLTGRQVYTTGIVGYFASWLVSFIMFSQPLTL